MVEETLDTRPSRYADAPFDVILAQGYVTKNYGTYIAKYLQPEWEADETGYMARVWCVGAIFKHLARLGLKDDVAAELMKIENYAHYARTGEWIDE